MIKSNQRPTKIVASDGGSADFDQVLKGSPLASRHTRSISYRCIKLNFGLDDNGLEELRRELIAIKRLAADCRPTADLGRRWPMPDTWRPWQRTITLISSSIPSTTSVRVTLLSLRWSKDIKSTKLG